MAKKKNTPNITDLHPFWQDTNVNWKNQEEVWNYFTDMFNNNQDVLKEYYLFKDFDFQKTPTSRKKAWIDAAIQVYKHYSDIMVKEMGRLPTKVELQRLYAYYCFNPMYPAILDELTVPTLFNSTIWILKQAKKYYFYKDLEKILEDVPIIYNIPLIVCDYNNIIFWKLFSVLLLKNLNTRNDKVNGKFLVSFVDKTKIKYNSLANPENHNLFKSIISLIPVNEIEDCKETLRKNCDEYIKILAQNIRPDLKLYIFAEKELDKLNAFNKTIPDPQSLNKLSVPLFYSIEEPKQTDSLFSENRPPEEILLDISDKPLELCKLQGKHIADFAKALDPYKISFASIVMGEETDPIIFSFFPFIEVLELALQETKVSLVSDIDTEIEKAASSFIPEEADENDNTAEVSFIDYNDKDFLIFDDWMETKNKETLRNIIQMITGVFLPEDMVPYQIAVARAFSKLTEDLNTEENIYIRTICEAVVATRLAINKCASVQEPEDTSQDISKKETIKNLQAECASLKQTIRDIKKNNYDEHNKLVDLQEEYSRYKETAEYDKQELNRLRDIFFQIENETPNEQLETDTETYPYEIKKQIIVVGGFEDWSKEIKNYFSGNLTLLPTGIHLQKNFIANADLVVFQVNKISHSFYHKVRGEAQRANVPITYFSSTGVKRCVKELIEFDKED